MSCCNPNCSSYIQNCTDYSYVCPSCTDCCTEYINSKCIKYKGAALSCIPVATNDTLEAIIIALNTTMSTTVCKTYDIQCLGGASNASSIVTIQALVDAACEEATNLFDTSCLGGDEDVDIFTAMSDVITRICASSATYPTFDTTCMVGGEAVDSLAGAVQLLITDACNGPTCTLDWETLDAPEDITDTPLCDMLQAILDNLKCSLLTFSDAFDVTGSCARAVALDYDVVAENVLDTIYGDETFTETFNDIVDLRVFANETTGPNSIEEALAFTDEMDVRTLTLTPYTFTLRIGNGGAGNVFVGLITGTNVYKAPVSILLSNTTAIKAFLDGTELSTFTVTAGIGYVDITFIMHGDGSTWYPQAVWQNTAATTDLFSTLQSAAQQSATPTNFLQIGIKPPAAWTTASLLNGWSGTIKYRFNSLNNSVEVRGGTISRALGSGELTAAAPITQTIFTIGSYVSDGDNYQYGSTLTNVVTQSIYTGTVANSDQASARIKTDVYINNGSSNVNINIKDALRSGSISAETLIVTIPTFQIFT